MSTPELFPLISVIVCTRNRPQDIELCLPTVLANDYPHFEVILIDQSTDSQTEALAEQWRQDFPYLRYISTPTVGKTRALNIALGEARGAIFAFTDDDCEAPTDWLRRIAHEFQMDHKVDIIFGPVLPSPALAGLKGVCVPSWTFSEKRELRQGEVCGMGANMAMSRSALKHLSDFGLGMFDTVLGPGAPFPAGEEGDFVYRLRRAGVAAGLRPSLLLYHRACRTREHWKSVLYGYGAGDAAFHAKHARCRDFWALRTICGRLFRYGTRTVIKSILRRNNDDLEYLRGYWRGLLASRCYPVDHARQVYLSADDQTTTHPQKHMAQRLPS